MSDDAQRQQRVSDSVACPVINSLLYSRACRPRLTASSPLPHTHNRIPAAGCRFRTRDPPTNCDFWSGFQSAICSSLINLGSPTVIDIVCMHHENPGNMGPTRTITAFYVLLASLVESECSLFYHVSTLAGLYSG